MAVLRDEEMKSEQVRGAVDLRSHRSLRPVRQNFEVIRKNAIFRGFSINRTPFCGKVKGWRRLSWDNRYMADLTSLIPYLSIRGFIGCLGIGSSIFQRASQKADSQSLFVSLVIFKLKSYALLHFSRLRHTSVYSVYRGTKVESIV